MDSDERRDGELESAMDTGSDAGVPGVHPVDDLSPEDLAVLEELRRPGPHPPGQAVEDGPAAQAAVADDAPLPPPAGGES
ncbi:MAG: hypothetical protein ACJ74O_04240 [Frankiaceae bacterium]